MDGGDRRRAQGFEGEVPVGHRVQGIGRGPIEAQRLGRHLAVDGKGRAGQGGGAQGALVHPRARVGEAAGVAAEHLHIGHQVVAECHRLGRLQVGEARHERVGVGGRAVDQGALKSAKAADRLFAGAAHPEAKIERHLVIARASGVQPSRGVSDQLGQPRLDVHVDVFELVAEREVAIDDLGFHAG